ncbi:uncharacterized protein KY384_007435 [Bacidia gigantensis]|uniref:uncharacterized protein n=1 Tax=Bacidia gigantensis TaxID=2732470 RepID=UPI001D05B3F4|nr:uncharacterized protein KY384_007435 [Bacidia gigantensis]KAG8528517.1 hypothetical protein KY384_007435 [Bacidia gigantensis]
MRRFLQQLPQSHHRRIILTCATSALALGLFPKEVLRNDSQSGIEWTPSQITKAEHRSIAARKPAENEHNSQGKSGAKSDNDELPLFEDEDSAAWAQFSSSFANVRRSLSSIPWSDVGDKIANRMAPAWVLQLPGYVTKLQLELDMKPGSLADEIWQEAQDPYIHPEVDWNTTVRISKDLCPEEAAFIKLRKQHTTRALARYLDIPVADVDPEDVPTVAICGSGGGLRALVSGTSSYLCAQEAGLFDCATYTAGVSGSCWLQALYNSSIGDTKHGNVIQHLKKRIGTHIAYPPSFLELLTRSPTSKYLLTGTVERLKGDPKAEFGLVDVYGLLLATRLLVPKDELDVSIKDMKLSEQRKYVSAGQQPLPIYSAVRHEIPFEDLQAKGGKGPEAMKEKVKQEAWFQWFEFTPYEVWCEDFGAGIPAWSVGRHFEDGRTVPSQYGGGLPELRMPFLLGVWGSAFCATLAHYYKEVKPILKTFTGFEQIDQALEKKNDELTKVHPFEPGTIPNFAFQMKGKLPATCPENAFNQEYLQLMDAGMDNNLPIYPLLRQGRDVDIIVCFDASADIKQENWLSVADGYATQRSIKGWPLGAGWPKQELSIEDTHKVLDEIDATAPGKAIEKVEEAVKTKEQRHEKDDKANDSTSQPAPQSAPDSELGYCNVWVGTTLTRTSTAEPPKSKRLQPNEDWELASPDAGITMIYFPLLPNPKVEGVDPEKSPYLSTWNFIYTPDEIDNVVALARANFEAGAAQTKQTIRAVYERRKARRLKSEADSDKQRWASRVRRGGDQFR